ncbi:MAG: hypothetical protein KKH74_06460 [Gammaproteobacteria bacterium]|nr:hypothetical protein [Gammaproteobacteria bacterium]MBU1732285.1 hypothetical protein [Gammaproteobacteria bacterium]MBU1893855.1 hypothetical protein [Gammaproteobacteria bacterium]
MSENEIRLRIENAELKLMVFQLQHQIASNEKQQLLTELKRVESEAVNE